LTEIPAVFVALASLVLFSRHRPFLAGLVGGIAFLTKFPMALVIVALGLSCLWERRFRDGLLVVAGSLVPIAPYLVFNHILYSNAFEPFIVGNQVIARAGIWLYREPFWFYLIELVKQNVFALFAIPGAFLAWRKDKQLVLAAVLLIAYFTSIPHKEVRFVTLFLPFVLLLAVRGLETIKGKHWLLITLSVVFVVQSAVGIAAGWQAEGAPDSVLADYYHSLENVSGVVGVSNPSFAFFTDARIDPLYYPLFDAQSVHGFLTRASSHGVIAISECDLPCAPGDVRCVVERARAFAFLRAEYHVLRGFSLDGCAFEMLRRKT
jgi:hypothetical protein